MKPTTYLHNVIQFLLVAISINCMLIASSTYIFGPHNLLQQSWYPSLGIVGVVFLLLFKLPKNDSSDWK